MMPCRRTQPSSTASGTTPPATAPASPIRSGGGRRAAGRVV